MDTNKNTGIIIVSLSPKNFKLGAESGVLFENRVPTGDWSIYQPTREIQKTDKYDTMSCVTFSALNSLEMQFNWLRASGKISAEILKQLADWGYMDENNNLNCSDWFTAVMSGTSKNGNDFTSVWDSICSHGLLPQKEGHAPDEFNTIDEWLDKTRVTTIQKEKALRFKEIFEVAHEYILTGVSNPNTIAEHLKHAPIHVATPTCGGWSVEDIVKACGLTQTSHVICADNSEKDVSTSIYDHYDPINKKLEWNYPIPWAVKGVLSLKTPKPLPQKPNYIFTKTLKKGDKGLDVKVLQDSLKYFGFLKLDNTTDFFGYRTEQAVRDFQMFYKGEILTPIGLSLPTGVFAKMSILKLNSLLSTP